jgi:hypothetical protein
MRQTAGKILTSQAATQVAEKKKRRGKRTRSAVSVETIDVEEDEGDVQLSKATMAPSPGRQAVETPRPTLGVLGLSTSSTSPADDAGSNKRLKKAPPKPCKPNLRSETK